MADSGAAKPRIQIVNEQKQFSNQLSHCLQNDWHIAECGFNYNVVAVMGSQSTGKSTLLNRLFKTDFEVMNEGNRGQTTKGIWLGCSTNNTLVMDVEGTDGRERGEDQDFERKSSLFALSIAEVIVINLWESTVGLYHGANLHLLKTVLDVNLQLFRKKDSPKTLLFFVIRDHLGTTPLENLSKILSSDIDNIWNGISKPKDLEDSYFSDFFDIQFAALPHKILMPDQFEAQSEKLRERFIDSSHSDYVFQKQYKKGIPADGFHIFAQDIWDQINANRDLDLPTQQELLAQFRCDELGQSALQKFLSEIKAVKQPIDAGGVVEKLGEKLKTIRDTCIEKFDKQGSRYHHEVYVRKRGDMINNMHTAVDLFFVE